MAKPTLSPVPGRLRLRRCWWRRSGARRRSHRCLRPCRARRRLQGWPGLGSRRGNPLDGYGRFRSSLARRLPSAAWRKLKSGSGFGEDRGPRSGRPGSMVAGRRLVFRFHHGATWAEETAGPRRAVRNSRTPRIQRLRFEATAHTGPACGVLSRAHGGAWGLPSVLALRFGAALVAGCAPVGLRTLPPRRLSRSPEIARVAERER